LGKALLNDAEAAFYDRLDEFCLGYLKNTDRSAIKSSLLEDRWCVASGVSYANLGLMYEEAGDVYYWFLYNCPQYYFFGPGYLRTNSEIQPYVYARWVDGNECAEVTNDLFDKLDGWIALVDENAGTTYQKGYLANDFLCETVTYDYESLEDDQVEKLSLNQSLYTAVLSENTVCAGYSKVFTAMMSAMDVSATGGLSTGHAWNEVLCDDQNYYCVDVCWNATGGDKLGYLNVGDATSKVRDGGQESHVYSYPEAQWIPEISKTDYQPTTHDIKGKKVLVGMPDPIQITVLNGGEHDNGLLIDWPEVEGTRQYEFAIFPNSSYSEIMVTSKGKRLKRIDEPQAKFWNLEPEKMYYYGVRAVKTVGETESYSEWTSISFKLGDLKAIANNQLPKPANLKWEKDKEKEDVVNFSWNVVDGAEKYQFSRFTDETYETFVEKSSGGYQSWDREKPQITLGPFYIGRSYHYGVRAVKNVDGTEVYSDWTHLSFSFR